MGLIGDIVGVVLGNGRNVVRETVEVFRPNAEAEAMRDAARSAAALAQYATEFALPQRGWFDRFMDGLNRLPRPMLALGTLGLFVAAMTDPIWFAQRMQGVALVPEPLWWLMGAVVSFYFGARHQTKFQEFQKDLAETLARTPEVARQIQDIADSDMDVVPGLPDNETWDQAPNAALEEWRGRHGG